MFYNLNLSGVNSAAIAWYEFLPGTPVKTNLAAEYDAAINAAIEPHIKLVMMNGALFEISGDEAQALYDQLTLDGKDLPQLSQERQQALTDLRAFVNKAREFCPLSAIVADRALEVITG